MVIWGDFKPDEEYKRHAVCMVEFEFDKRDDISNLMKVKGRNWGSLLFSIACGIDFPSLLYELLIYGNDDSIVDYSRNIKCCWLIPGGILWFLSAFSRSGSKFKVLKDFFTFQGIYYDILSMKDTLPTVWVFKRLINRLPLLHPEDKILAGKFRK